MNCTCFLFLVGYVVVLASCHVLIYQDAATDKTMGHHLLRALEVAQITNVQAVGPSFFKIKSWDRNVSLLIFPDEVDGRYGEALELIDLEAIRQWVRDGGSLLGIGAGAYLASERIVYQLGKGDEEVQRNGPLALFPGTACGPAIEPLTRRWEDEPRATLITIIGEETVHPPLPVYAIGACYFSKKQVAEAAWTTLAEYTEVEDNPAAIIQGFFGKGKVLLSGPNWTVDDELMVGLEKTKMCADLLGGAEARRVLIKRMFSLLSVNKDSDASRNVQ